jgi:hypothetical protein
VRTRTPCHKISSCRMDRQHYYHMNHSCVLVRHRSCIGSNGSCRSCRNYRSYGSYELLRMSFCFNCLCIYTGLTSTASSLQFNLTVLKSQLFVPCDTSRSLAPGSEKGVLVKFRPIKRVCETFLANKMSRHNQIPIKQPIRSQMSRDQISCKFFLG